MPDPEAFAREQNDAAPGTAGCNGQNVALVTTGIGDRRSVAGAAETMRASLSGGSA